MHNLLQKYIENTGHSGYSYSNCSVEKVSVMLLNSITLFELAYNDSIIFNISSDMPKFAMKLRNTLCNTLSKAFLNQSSCGDIFLNLSAFV